MSGYLRLSTYIAIFVCLTATTTIAATEGFDALMSRAMQQMDGEMMHSPTGDPDRDFAAMMIPHHQGAIDMAKAELQFGKDARLRRLAQGIIVEQAQEIAVMRQISANLPAHNSSKH